MLLHFSKCCSLLILSISMQIKFQLLPFILVVTDVEVSPSTASSANDKSFSSTYTSSSSGESILALSSRYIPIYIRRNNNILVIFSSFSFRRLYLFIHLGFSFSTCQFRLSCIFTFNFFLVFLRSSSFSYFYILLSCLVMRLYLLSC